MVSKDSSIAPCGKSGTKNGDWLSNGLQNINSTREARVSGMDEITASLDAYSYSPERNSNRRPALRRCLRLPTAKAWCARPVAAV